MVPAMPERHPGRRRQRLQHLPGGQAVRRKPPRRVGKEDGSASDDKRDDCERSEHRTSRGFELLEHSTPLCCDRWFWSKFLVLRLKPSAARRSFQDAENRFGIARFGPLGAGLVQASVSSSQSKIRAKASRLAPTWQWAPAASAVVKRTMVLGQVKWSYSSCGWPLRNRSSSASQTSVGQLICSAIP